MEISSPPLTEDMIAYIAQQIETLIQNIPTSAIKSRKSPTEQPPPPPTLRDFIRSVSTASLVPTATLLCSTVYIKSVITNLDPSTTKKVKSTGHRMFLAAVMLASKFLNDRAPRATDWVYYAGGFFSLEDVNLMERQFLRILRWDLRINFDDYLNHILPFLTRPRVISPPTPPSSPRLSPEPIPQSQSKSARRRFAKRKRALKESQKFNDKGEK